MSRLPEHIEPMLARIGEPFDSDEHVFELKWDGVRAVSYVEEGALRMHGRRRRDLAERYPELQFLRELPDGTVVDGELVVLRDDGRPDFRAAVARENATRASVATAARRHPIVYVVFDLLYLEHASWLDRPLVERRARLGQLVADHGMGHWAFSDGVVGDGSSLFEAACARDLEGIVAKRLDAPYRPGERSDAWQKIKPVHSVHCVVLGYEPDDAPHGRGFKSLIVATDVDGTLRCVGRVGSGISEAQHRELWQLLQARRADAPLIDAGMRGVWVEPGIYCTVRFLERTESGNLRAPVFAGLVDGGGS